MSALPTTREVSSGGAIVRWHEGQPQVCLVARGHGRKRVWGLPKGHVEAGERLRETAMREVEEETGLQGTVQTKLGAITYWFTPPHSYPARQGGEDAIMAPKDSSQPGMSGRAGRGAGFTEAGRRIFKIVHFYLMRYDAGEPRAQMDEVEDAAWVPLEEALKRVAYPNERRVLQKAKRILAARHEPPMTDAPSASGEGTT